MFVIAARTWPRKALCGLFLPAEAGVARHRAGGLTPKQALPDTAKAGLHRSRRRQTPRRRVDAEVALHSQTPEVMPAVSDGD